MNRSGSAWWAGACLVAAAGALLSACSSSSPSSATMMSNGRGYQLSPVSCRVPDTLPGARVDVTLADMGMSVMVGGTAAPGARMLLQASPADVPAGRISVVASNRGWRSHELVILSLTGAADAGARIPSVQGTVSEKGSDGEASAACLAGAGDGIPAGSASWVTVTLPAGRYELVCNLTNHYADGMYQLLTVT